ncbi:MAG: DUF5050 domain-containing protein [Clostridium sp.]|nr:DUF5050 domain-containing protein [Clostridium sp.]
MKRKITEKKVLSMLSTAVDNLEVDVWDKIVNSKKSGLEEIDSSYIESPKQNKIFVPRRIASIAVACIFMIIGIYAFLNISGIIPFKNLNPNMYFSPFLAIAEYDNKLYFQNFKDGRKLYSMDLDGNNIAKINNDSILNFTIYNNDIYYINSTDGKIVVLKTDGTHKKVLENTNANRNIAVFGDWIFYTSDDGIYRIKSDGAHNEKISDIIVHTLCVYGENVYFSSGNENQEGLYKAGLDGKNIVKIYAKTVSGFSVYENNIYFCNIYDNYCLYRIAADGSKIEKLKSNGKDILISTGAFDIFNDEIYFINESFENTCYLFKMDLDTANLTKLAEIEATTIKVFEKNIYLYHPSYNGRLYRLSTYENNLEEIPSK